MKRYGATNDGLKENPYGMWCQYSECAVPQKVVRSAEILRDWLLPYGHPDKGSVGINPINLMPEELTYKSRDEAAMEIADFILKLAKSG